MPEIKIEYPKAQQFIEMTLVDMLTEKRCWNDINKISDALHNVRKHAKSMQEERRMFCEKEQAGNTKKAPQPTKQSEA